MKTSRLRQIFGVFVVMMAGFAVLATTQLSAATGVHLGLQVIAHFTNVGAARWRANDDGRCFHWRVEAIGLDGNTFEAVVMRIDAEHTTLPADSSASI